MNLLKIVMSTGCRGGLGNKVHIRCITQLNHHDGESLWKSVQADTGKVGGRGKRTKRRKAIDLGRDKVLGEGKAGYKWPGLNTGVREKFSRRSKEEQAEWENAQTKLVMAKHKNIDSTMRGWTGGLWGGQKLLPDDEDEYSTQFDAYLLEAARVSHMTASTGRVYSMRTIVATGNKNGTFGIGMHTAQDVPNSARKARLKALKRLQFVERFEDRTVFEDMYVNHHRTFMHIRQQPEGYGLRCHRLVKTLCDVIGIKDLYVNTNGGTTPLSLVKCFIKALHGQETHQEKADRLGYHIVQYDPLYDNYPVVLASPKNETKKEPYDEYRMYLNKPLITKAVRREEGYMQHPWLTIMYPHSQGPPIPNQSEVPKILSKIKEASI